MAVTYGFFNSVNGDRKYNAEQMSEYFRGIVSQGVFQHLDSGMAVSAGTGLSVSVAAGRAIIQNRWVQNSAALNLTISDASETYGRKDAVVIRLDKSSRAISIAVKTGTPAASPVAPSMTRNATTYEMALAYVNVAAGASSVTVTDKRSDSSVCGWASVAQATSGEVDQMLNDMKTGFDGVVYDSPGAEVRGSDQRLQDEITANTGVINMTFQPGYYNTATVGSTVSGITASTTISCAIAPCTSDDVVTVNLDGSTNGRAWAFLDENYVVLSNSDSYAKPTHLVLPKAPDGTAYVALNNRINYKPTGYYGRIGKYMKNVVSEMEGIIYELNDVVSLDSVSVPYSIEGTGVIRYGNGKIDGSSTYAYTNYIDVRKYDQITYSRVNNEGMSNKNTGIAFYDENKTYVDGIQALFTASPAQYDSHTTYIPKNAVYARFTTFVNTGTYGKFSLVGTTSKIQQENLTNEHRIDSAIGNGLIPVLPGYILNEANPINFETSWRSHVSRVHSIVPCRQGDVFTVSGFSANSPRAWAFYDENYNELLKERTEVTITNKKIVAPKDAAWLTINANNISVRSYYGDTYKRENLIPDYYGEGEYLLERMNAVEDHYEDCSLNGDQFIWITDMHLWRDNLCTPENGLQSAKLIKYITDHSGINTVVFGGDSISGNELSKDEAIWMMSEFKKYMSIIQPKSFMIYGNHEWNNPGATAEQEVNELTANECYSIFCKDKEREFGSISPKGDYWFDNSIQKIRYFCINCKKNATIFVETTSWFGQELEDVPNGYTIVVLSHIGVNVIADDNVVIADSLSGITSMMDALKTGTSVTVGGVTYDYTGKDVDVACLISGHVHSDYAISTPEGIPVISVVCDRAARSNSSDLFKAVRKIGTIGEQAFDVVQIDKTNRKIYFTRFGGSTIGASYDSETGKIYDTVAGTGTEYTGTEWTLQNTYKDREYSY